MNAYGDSDGDGWQYAPGPPGDAESFEQLLGRSSFGTPGARQLRARGRYARDRLAWPETGAERSQREMEVTFIPPVFTMQVLVAGDTIAELEAEACNLVQARTTWHGRLEVVTHPFPVHEFPPAARLVTGTVPQDVQELAESGKRFHARISVGGWPAPEPRPGAPFSGISFRYPQRRVMLMLAEVLGVKGRDSLNTGQLTERCLSAAVKLTAIANAMPPPPAPGKPPFTMEPGEKAHLLDELVGAPPGYPHQMSPGTAKHNGMTRDQAHFALTHDAASSGLIGANIASDLLDQAQISGTAVTAAVTITYDAGAEAWNLDWHTP